MKGDNVKIIDRLDAKPTAMAGRYSACNAHIDG